MKNNKIRIWQKGNEICWSYAGKSKLFLGTKLTPVKYGKSEINLGKTGWRQIGTFISKTGIRGNCGLGSATGIK